MINAIPTEYNGCRFRSGLEARWAVFFDLLGIEYGYASDDLITKQNVPSFYLPALHCYFEVKEKCLVRTNEGEDAIKKIMSLPTLNQAGIITFGDPTDYHSELICPLVINNTGSDDDFRVIFWAAPKIILGFNCATQESALARKGWSGRNNLMYVLLDETVSISYGRIRMKKNSARRIFRSLSAEDISWFERYVRGFTINQDALESINNKILTIDASANDFDALRHALNAVKIARNENWSEHHVLHVIQNDEVLKIPTVDESEIDVDATRGAALTAMLWDFR